MFPPRNNQYYQNKKSKNIAFANDPDLQTPVRKGWLSYRLFLRIGMYILGKLPEKESIFEILGVVNKISIEHASVSCKLFRNAYSITYGFLTRVGDFNSYMDRLFYRHVCSARQLST